MGARAAGFIAGAAMALLALSPFQARAQSGAACPIGAPVTITASSLALTNNNECQAIIFTSPNPISVTAPAATSVAPGFQVMIFAINNGVTITSAAMINNVTSGIVIGPGQSGLLYGDGAKYWFANGSGFASTAPNSTLSSVNLGRLPGTTASNSPLQALPNGLIQFTNDASFRPGNYPFAACAGAPMAIGAGAPGTPRSPYVPKPWLQIIDDNDQTWLIPLCRPNP